MQFEPRLFVAELRASRVAGLLSALRVAFLLATTAALVAACGLLVRVFHGA